MPDADLSLRLLRDRAKLLEQEAGQLRQLAQAVHYQRVEAELVKALQGKEEVRKEIALIGMAHRTAYVMQGSISNPTHLIEGFIDGLNARRPALFNI